MKLKLILLSSIFAFFMSCKDSNQTPETAETETEHHHDHDSDEMHSHDEHGMEAGTVLALNNGEKWKSDDPTSKHAQNLIGLDQEFRPRAADANLEMFRNYADMLQQELNGMIKDCKMDGPDHDALHLWLEPVLHGVKELKNAETDEKAKKIDADLSEKIIKYDQFFN
ncbi:MAG: hypothetical protein WCY16_10330 [Weeksellaceae bacterium]